MTEQVDSCFASTIIQTTLGQDTQQSTFSSINIPNTYIISYVESDVQATLISKASTASERFRIMTMPIHPPLLMVL
jgi:hypothetical protein